jgi:pre-mRNA-splicing factor SYF1
MYADLEEEYGLLNNCIKILDKACNDVPKDDKPEIYSVLIAKTASFFGINKTRIIFDVSHSIYPSVL